MLSGHAHCATAAQCLCCSPPSVPSEVKLATSLDDALVLRESLYGNLLTTMGLVKVPIGLPTVAPVTLLYFLGV